MVLVGTAPAGTVIVGSVFSCGVDTGGQAPGSSRSARRPRSAWSCNRRRVVGAGGNGEMRRADGADSTDDSSSRPSCSCSGGVNGQHDRDDRDHRAKRQAHRGTPARLGASLRLGDHAALVPLTGYLTLPVLAGHAASSGIVHAGGSSRGSRAAVFERADSLGGPVGSASSATARGVASRDEFARAHQPRAGRKDDRARRRVPDWPLRRELLRRRAGSRVSGA